MAVTQTNILPNVKVDYLFLLLIVLKLAKNLLQPEIKSKTQTGLVFRKIGQAGIDLITKKKDTSIASFKAIKTTKVNSKQR